MAEELEAGAAQRVVPALVVRLITPPLNRPNSAGGLLLSILNSWIASMLGKNATCPGSGCSTEMPSNRYSFVRGRPPLMRGNGAAGGGGSATPGTKRGQRDEAATVERQIDDLPVVHDLTKDAVSSAKQRRIGSDGDRLGHIPPTVDLQVRDRTVSPVARRMPSRVSVRKPLSSTRTQ